MKTDIHPKYFDSVEIRCSCGNVIISGSTKEKLKTELCSKCHPFYTGQQKLVDTAGRVDKFQAMRKKSVELKDEAKRRTEAKKKKPETYKEKEVPTAVLKKALAEEQKQAASKWGKPLGKTLSEEVAEEEMIEAKAAKKKKTTAKKVVVKKAALKKPVKKVAAKKETKKK